MGQITTASGTSSTAMGSNTNAKSFGETAIGTNNTDYTPNSTNSYDAADRLFVIGNGENASNKSDAMVVLKNGNTTINGTTNVNNHQIKNLADPTDDQDAVTQSYLVGQTQQLQAAIAQLQAQINSIRYTFSLSLYPVGSVFCASGATLVVDVTSLTGKIWMDRNLGASQAATSSTDANSYGDLYQWGRSNDGHQCRTSATTTTLSSTDEPANGSFILAPNSPFDWRSPQNNNLWQGVNGINNPCPSGYRLPTNTELNTERSSWSQNNSAGAIASPLKLPVPGYRNIYSGFPSDVGGIGLYWSSSVNGTNSDLLYFSGGAQVYSYERARGFSVRCIKD
jgi:hypothetical protein